jgi:hypothetical protein
MLLGFRSWPRNGRSDALASSAERTEKAARARPGPHAWLLLLGWPAFAVSCTGTPTGPDSSNATVLTGRALVADSGNFAVVADGEFAEDGRLHAQLRWRVVEPGRGSRASEPPKLLLEFVRNCPGSQCPGYASAGPAPEGPLSVTGEVHPASAYMVRIAHRGGCGGCQVEYTLDVGHPRGALRLRPADTCPTYTLGFPHVTGPQPTIDPEGSPPQVRMKVGDRVLIAVQPRCPSTPAHQVTGWSVTDSSVASLEEGSSVFLKAERVGQTRVIADVAHVDGSRVQAELGTCTVVGPCSPVRLVLNVVR